MKKTLVYGIIIFFASSLMIGCGKSSKSASSPTPTTDNGTANVTDIANTFGANSGTSTNTLNIVGKTVVVSDVNAFNAMIGSTGSSFFPTNLTNGVTGNSTIDNILACGFGSLVQGGTAYLLNELFNNGNGNVNIDGTCISGFANNGTIGNTIGTNGVVVQQGQSYIFNGQLNSSNFTGSISTSSATSPFFTFSAVKERAQNGSYVYRDAGRNLIIAVDGQNVLGLFYNNGSSWVRAGRIGL